MGFSAGATRYVTLFGFVAGAVAPVVPVVVGGPPPVPPPVVAPLIPPPPPPSTGTRPPPLRPTGYPLAGPGWPSPHERVIPRRAGQAVAGRLMARAVLGAVRASSAVALRPAVRVAPPRMRAGWARVARALRGELTVGVARARVGVVAVSRGHSAAHRRLEAQTEELMLLWLSLFDRA